jgi:hypothetical protein
MQKKDLLFFMSNYLEALIHNKPETVPLAANCKATYQGVKTPLGSGEIWGVPRRIPYRQTFVDSVTKTVCFSGVVTNNVGYRTVVVENPMDLKGYQKWWIYYVRITLDDSGQACEIEEIARKETGQHLDVRPVDMDPPRILETPIPEDARSTRKEMIKIASQYWDGVQKIIDPNLVPIHPDARLYEVGTPVSDTMYSPNSFKTFLITPSFVWECVKRRYPVVDEVTGICISTNYMIAQEPVSPSGYVTDIFKIEYGLIKYIYAFHDHEVPFVDWEGEGPQTSAECD